MNFKSGKRKPGGRNDLLVPSGSLRLWRTVMLTVAFNAPVSVGSYIAYT